MKILILAPTLAFLDMAPAFLGVAPLAGMLVTAAAVAAAMLILFRLASTPLPE